MKGENGMMNKDTPHFSPQELRAIYAAAAEKTKDGMSAAARALYPAREDALKTLYWLPGGGRAFRCSDGSCSKPALHCSLGPLRWLSWRMARCWTTETAWI